MIDRTGLLIALGAAAYLALHFFEPALSMTWSYAHLGRYALLPWLGAALVIALPVATSRLWDSPWARAPLVKPSWRTIAISFVLLWAVLIVVGLLWPSPPATFDARYLTYALTRDKEPNTRWYFSALFFKVLFDALRGAVDPVLFLRVANAGISAANMLVSVGCARLLGRDRREAIAIALLFWTALGNLQLALGYIDIYPIVQLALLVYFWTALRFLDGRGSLAVAFAVGALLPYFYIGLGLIAPSMALLALVALRQPRGLARVSAALAVAILSFGLATTPEFGHPFAFAELLGKIRSESSHSWALSRTSTWLPASYMWTFRHVLELVHGFILMDGMGMWLCLTAGFAVLAPRAGRAPDLRGWLFALVLVPMLIFMFAFDPVWGPYADWDAFSYFTVATSLLGGYALVAWGREQPRFCASLLGLVLAASSVHLLARLNGLTIERGRHLKESPIHFVVPEAARRAIQDSRSERRERSRERGRMRRQSAPPADATQ